MTNVKCNSLKKSVSVRSFPVVLRVQIPSEIEKHCIMLREVKSFLNNFCVRGHADGSCLVISKSKAVTW